MFKSMKLVVKQMSISTMVSYQFAFAVKTVLSLAVNVNVIPTLSNPAATYVINVLSLVFTEKTTGSELAVIKLGNVLPLKV